MYFLSWRVHYASEQLDMNEGFKALKSIIGLYHLHVRQEFRICDSAHRHNFLFEHLYPVCVL